jgi:hypothetical protein
MKKIKLKASIFHILEKNHLQNSAIMCIIGEERVCDFVYQWAH